MDQAASRKNAALLLREGRIEEAAGVLRSAGLALEAADILAEQGSYGAAADVLVGGAALDALDRRVLTRAVAYLERAGRFDEAARACVALGDNARAAALMGRISSVPPGRVSDVHGARDSRAYDRSSSPGRIPTPATGAPQSMAPRSAAHHQRAEELGRALEQQGRHDEAARVYAEAGILGSAVRAYLAAGDRVRALKTLLRIPRDNPRYRQAAVLAIELAEGVDEVDFDFDQFIGRFLEGTPTTQEECAAFLRAARLFERHDFTETARDVVARLAAAHPQFPGARALHESLDLKVRGSVSQLERVVREDDSFRARSADRRPSDRSPAKKAETFPSLPEIPAPRARREPSGKRPVERGDSDAPRPSLPPVSAGPARPRFENVHLLQPGTIVADRYKLEKKLGSGGMAAVYAAHDLELGETIAIKLFARGGTDPALLSRFRQELALARQISHPNVVRLYDIGAHDDVRFITMEILSGKDLADTLDESRDLLRDLGYLIQVCEAVNCVHERGVVHRDLKPENLFVTNEGVVKLMDFGIAKRKEQGQANLTVEGFTAGTPAYMAPEQINDFKNATHLADIYSIGVIAYRMFAGVLPFDHENSMAVLMKHLNDAPTPPSQWDDSIPEELEFIILQLLEKNPARRVQSSRELAGDLRALAQRLGGARRRR
jgi:serine/threonine-protein kinase